ncbi:PUA-like domain-containing protein [Lipomyces tetrasporus]|uniref:Translation machinery-associated protein 20 n=1 Tax=Lipomyces tetrasporus TaxID=54092 RepID=A0AAD7QK73_9ASCO|nr:PUA-like domain-containing protein [Lipomyces tetrasporus]KAJ8096736.1 PUA-like domain-containing protein [Lipomyces tetrasporus]
MFKKFNSKDDIHSRTNVKSSVQRGLKSKLIEQFPKLDHVIDEIIPKKGQLVVIKCTDRLSLYAMDNEVLFYQQFDDPFVPSLRLVHKFPEYFPSVKVDRGAIKFILSGANIMCPGLTSKGAALPDENFPAGTVVAIFAEGKETALAVGKLTMDTDEIKKVNKGMGIEVGTYLGDGLWSLELE